MGEVSEEGWKGEGDLLPRMPSEGGAVRRMEQKRRPVPLYLQVL